MAEGFDDLLPMFLAEASERLNRLGRLLLGRSTDADFIRARRELHALKGAGRMLGLAEFAALCHQAEALLEDPNPDDLGEVREIHRQLTGMAAGETVSVAGQPPQPEDRDPRSIPGAYNLEQGHPIAPDVRVPTEVMDGLSERGARMRVLSVGSASLVNRVFRLAHLAEKGVGEAAPRQVLATLATSLRQLGVEFDAGQRRLQRLSEGLLDALLKQQVRPLRPVLDSLATHARELSESLGKKLRVSITGGETQLDRRIISGLQEVLVHVVRNAVDHGIESPSERSKVGKKATGELRLEAGSEGHRVRLTVRDDGCGVDLGVVVKTAVERGMLAPDEAEQIDHPRAMQLLCTPGFSTREKATDVSGRGIGLDAVASAVSALGGDLWIESEPGRGTTVTVEVPVARRGEQVIILRVGQSVVALPAAPIRSYRSLDLSETLTENGHSFLRVEGERIGVRYLSDLAGESPSEPAVVVLGHLSGVPQAVVADGLIGSEEVFLRPLPAGVGMPSVYDAMTVLASGRPAPVLSWRRIASQGEDSWKLPIGLSQVRTIKVLLVDDSRVTREMIRRLLEDAGFSVTTSGSAEEALDLLAAKSFDCLITDIEMPSTDGLELTRTLRSESRYEDLPIIVVSTRDRPSDHRAGMDAGADAYLSKQGLEAHELISLVRRSAGGGR